MFEGKVAFVGLGYIGLPLLNAALEKGMHAFGFDIDESRISELKAGFDRTNEVVNLAPQLGLFISSNTDDLCDIDVFVITVPTPVDDNKIPDLTSLTSAIDLAVEKCNTNGLVIVESTVFPGLTRELTSQAKKRRNRDDLQVGYSPERINPGDKFHDIQNVDKIVSGCSHKSRTLVEQVYSSFLNCNLHPASSIEAAEAAKVIENTQRDVNIALMNELDLLFRKAEIDFQEVLKLAGTKWNFLPFHPGLVGGHCIGVDPYYLLHFARKYNAPHSVVSTARQQNEIYVELKGLTLKSIVPRGSSCLFLGVAFKPDTPDLRNSGVLKIICDMSNDYRVAIHDPVIFVDQASVNKFKSSFGRIDVHIEVEPVFEEFDYIICAVRHQLFTDVYVSFERNNQPNVIWLDSI